MRITPPKRAIKKTPTIRTGVSRVEETYGKLLSLAHELGPRAKMPTVRELREDLNVSQATLDAAMVRLETQNVLVRRQGSGVYVSPRLKQRNIALLCDPEFFISSGVSPFWGHLVSQVRSLASQSEAVLNLQFLKPFVVDDLQITGDPEPIPAALQEAIHNQTVHGMICIGAPHPVSRWIEAQGVPVVAYAGAANYMLAHDNGALLEQGIAELMRQGCRSVMAWLPPFSPETRFVHEAYERAVLRHGKERFVPLFAAEAMPGGSASFGQYSFNLALQRFGVASLRPDGIVFVNDVHAQAVLMAFYRLGITVGKEVRVATHSNAGSPTLLAWHEQITRLEYDLSDLVTLLFETLDARMNGEEADWVLRGEGERVPEWRYSFTPKRIVPQPFL